MAFACLTSSWATAIASEASSFGLLEWDRPKRLGPFRTSSFITIDTPFNDQGKDHFGIEVVIDLVHYRIRYYLGILEAYGGVRTEPVLQTYLTKAQTVISFRPFNCFVHAFSQKGLFSQSCEVATCSEVNYYQIQVVAVKERGIHNCLNEGKELLHGVSYGSQSLSIV